MLFDNEKLEYLLYPNLYIVDQIRKDSGGLSTMEKVLGGIKFFIYWCDYKNINLEKRIANRSSNPNKSCPLFFTKSEVNQLVGDSSISMKDLVKKYQKHINKPGAGLLFLSPPQYETVSSENKHARLTYIANYLGWLHGEILSNKYTGDIQIRGDKTIELIKAYRPTISSFKNTTIDNGLNDEAMSLLIEVVDPSSEKNPFNEEDQIRNQLIIDLFRFFGLRSGELLKLRCHDFNFEKNIVSVTRIRNDKLDTRIYEPRSKTVARDFVALEGFMHRVREYIVNIRSKVKGSEKHPYLILSHHGPTVGQPLSKKSLSRVFSSIKNIDVDIFHNLTPHKMRHRWNYDLSNVFDTSIEQGEFISDEEQNKIRCQLAGWTKGSHMPFKYNEIHDYESSQEVCIQLQEDMVKKTNISGINLTKNNKGQE